MYQTQSGTLPKQESADAEVIARAQAGDGDAFRVLVERHARTVYNLAFRMTGNQHDAEDLVQETFLRACRQIHKFDGRAGFGTWLYRIAANCSVDHLRARQSRQRFIADVPGLPREGAPRESRREELERFPAATPSPERLVFSTKVLRLLTPALRQLSQKERAAFALRHYEGLSVAEIGVALKMRPAAAKHSVFRAVQKLRRALGPSLETPAAGSRQ